MLQVNMSLPNQPRPNEPSKAATLHLVVSLSNENEATPFVAEQKQERTERWLTRPKSLASGKPMELAMHIYDGLLCAISIALIVKTTLCIVAHHLEKVHGGDIDIRNTTSLTLSLVRVNEQVY